MAVSQAGAGAVRTGAGFEGREVVLTRTFDAPRALVFAAWTDPEHLARWWGPHGFTNPVCEVDARPGGAIRVDMTGPDEAVYPMGGIFQEVVPPERLVFTTTAFQDDQGRPLLENCNTVTFAERDGKTTITVRAVVVRAAPEMAGAVGGMEIGWAQSLERLETEVERARDGRPAVDEFLVMRQFDAPRDLVFRAWTEPDRLAKWLGPKGSTLVSSSLDLRPGGAFHYGMSTPDGQVMWGRWLFREVEPPSRLVFVFSFSDESGGVTRNPFAADWPLRVLGTLTFAEHGGKTLLVLRNAPLDATEAEVRAFGAGHASMQKGWAGSMDRLEAHLAADR